MVPFAVCWSWRSHWVFVAFLIKTPHFYRDQPSSFLLLCFLSLSLFDLGSFGTVIWLCHHAILIPSVLKVSVYMILTICSFHRDISCWCNQKRRVVSFWPFMDGIIHFVLLCCLSVLCCYCENRSIREGYTVYESRVLLRHDGCCVSMCVCAFAFFVYCALLTSEGVVSVFERQAPPPNLRGTAGELPIESETERSSCNPAWLWPSMDCRARPFSYASSLEPHCVSGLPHHTTTASKQSARHPSYSSG